MRRKKKYKIEGRRIPLPNGQILSKCEVIIASLLLLDYSQKEIAELRNLTIYTIDKHEQKLYVKTKTCSDKGFISYIYLNGLRSYFTYQPDYNKLPDYLDRSKGYRERKW